MIAIYGLVLLFSCFGFVSAYGMGVMEVLVLHAALIGVPTMAESFLMKEETKRFFKTLGQNEARDLWLFITAYLFFAVGMYYQAFPIVIDRFPAAARAQAFAVVFPMALVMAFPLMTIIILILDFKGVWTDLIARREGRGPSGGGGRPAKPSKPAPESDPSIGTFDPARFEREAPTPHKPMTIKRVSDSVVRGVDFARGRRDRTLH